MKICATASKHKLSFKHGDYEYDVWTDIDKYGLCAFLNGRHHACLLCVDVETQETIYKVDEHRLQIDDKLFIAIKVYMRMNTEVPLYQFLSETFNGNDSGIV